MRKSVSYFCIMLLLLFTELIYANPRLLPGEITAGSGFENHVPIHWAEHDGGTISEYRLYRKTAEGEYEIIETLTSSRIHTIDYDVISGVEYTYKISAVIGGVEVESINESLATCSDSGHFLIIPGFNTSSATIDGVFDEGEWDDAIELDITNNSLVWSNPLEEQTYAYIKCFNEKLYIAVRDYNDPTRDANDQLVILFDYNNDGLWTPADHDGKFNLMWYEVVGQELSLYIEINGTYPNYNFGPDYYDPEFITTRIEEDDNCLVYETEIELSNFVFDIDPENLGFMIQCLAYDANGNLNVTGMYPNNGIWAAPITFLNTSIQFEQTIIEGNVSLTGGTGDVEDVIVNAEGFTTNPDISGNYTLEIMAGTYDVTASLEGYVSQTIEDVEVSEGAVVSNIDFVLTPEVSADDDAVNAEFSFIQNYPNPFNPTTTISFSVTQSSSFVNLVIYNMKGQKVKQLVNEPLSAGQHSVVWNGKDGNGNPVASGLYFYKLKSGRYTSTKKMILMK